MGDGSERTHCAAMLIENRDALYAYVLACVRSHVDADDVMQNVSMAVIQSDDAPEEPHRFVAWAREIARRRVLEHYRTSRRLVPVDPNVVARLSEAAARVDAEQSGQTRREALLECLERLPPESQQLLAARYDGSSTDAVHLARRFGRSEQGVTSLLYRLRRALRDCIQQRLHLENA